MERDPKMTSSKLDDLSESKIEAILQDPVFDFCRKAERIVRPYSTSDFKKEPFIPDL